MLNENKQSFLHLFGYLILSFEGKSKIKRKSKNKKINIPNAKVFTYTCV